MTGPLRYIIDGIVLLAAAVWLIPLMVSFFTPYEDTVTPAETLALDERILEYADTHPENFSDLIAAPVPRTAYDLQYGQESDLTQTATQLYEATLPSMVYIYTVSLYGDFSGSGTVITEDGLIMTNYHNVEDADEVFVVTSEGIIYPVTAVVAYDSVLDIAFLQIPADDLTPAVLGEYDAVAIGETALAVGHSEGFINTISAGIISGKRDYDASGFGQQLQFTSPISAGNSGGALINAQGHVIGIPTSAVEYDQNAVQVQNINLAVSINDALAVLGL